MAWKNVSPFAIAPRRRVVATALMYGLSLTVRFTSAAGDETEIPAQAAQSASPMTSVMMNDSAKIFKDWSSKSARSIVFHRNSPKSCSAMCESPGPISSMSNCPP
jgi:hypothetical protein